MKKLPKSFYLRPALICAKEFLGKVLVHETFAGRISGIVYDIEAYPAFSDEVHHGNKKTPRTEIMWKEGGYKYYTPPKCERLLWWSKVNTRCFYSFMVLSFNPPAIASLRLQRAG